MKIGLLDVDSLGRKRGKGGMIFPNLALCKISAWHKSQGDVVEWANPFEHYDIVYKSKVFKFTPDDLTAYNADTIVKGGTGYDLTTTLPDHIDRIAPDFSIYPSVPADTSFGFLTRGCPNRCKWCVVPIKEGAVRPYMDIDQVANGRKKVVLMDNNILAAGDYGKAQLEKIIQKGYFVDFNQAMDARLVTDELAQILAKVRWIDRVIRFGCDTHAQIKYCEKAIELLVKYGFHGDVMLYTMLHGSIQECYERVNYLKNKNKEIHGTGARIKPYAQPYRDPNDPNHTPPQWQKDLAHWVNKKMIFESIDFADFEPRKGFRCAEYFKQL